MRGPCQLIFVVVIAFLTGCAAVREVGQRGVVIEDRSSTVAVQSVKSLNESKTTPQAAPKAKANGSIGAKTMPLEGEQRSLLPPSKQGADTLLASVIPPGSVTTTTTPAVQNLLKVAAGRREEGKLDEAAATLERALRIEPRNPLVWHHLAQLRYGQHDLNQAAQLAAKSNTYARSDVGLQARNWRLIAQVRAESGDKEGAAVAYGKADQLDQGNGGG